MRRLSSRWYSFAPSTSRAGRSKFEVLAVFLLVFAPTMLLAEDLVEFLNGARATGSMGEIRKDKKEFDFEIQLGGRKLVRTYSFDKVHAVTMQGKRHVLTPIEVVANNSAADSQVVRTKAQVLELIKTVGPTPPDWFESTPLDYPKSLELDWPLNPPEKGWNNQKNVGQYKWDVINPNPGRWKSGVRLIHHVMTLHKDQPALLHRDIKVLGEMYFELFQDYPRAAFWLQKANVKVPEPQSVHLAECYWRMGSKQMATELLNARSLPTNAIKLLGDMGQTDRAIQLAGAFAKMNRPHEAYLLAGDACRIAGRTKEAVAFYQKVIDSPDARNEEYTKRFQGRARDSIEAVTLAEQANVTKVADGAYRAASVGYSGPVEVEVRVADHRIEEVKVVKHVEKQFYAAITDTTNQIVKKQSVNGIDATTRATITSQAIVNATAKALAKGS
ncbi:MAG: FMN-binding protein [Planctomycetaceae bacterium]|nr:FMN-binding protein [Planctomycetales bacterium]MCB9921944.1 FMN-binding protein [Planctomycetaceae bacterium]